MLDKAVPKNTDLLNKISNPSWGIPLQELVKKAWLPTRIRRWDTITEDSTYLKHDMEKIQVGKQMGTSSQKFFYWGDYNIITSFFSFAFPPHNPLTFSFLFFQIHGLLFLLIVVACIFVYVYTYILKYVNIPYSVCMLLVQMFSELAVWYWITN